MSADRPHFSNSERWGFAFVLGNENTKYLYEKRGLAVKKYFRISMLFLPVLFMLLGCTGNISMIQKYTVEDNIFKCNTQPNLSISINKAMPYLGEFEFKNLGTGYDCAPLVKHTIHIFGVVNNRRLDRSVILYTQTIYQQTIEDQYIEWLDLPKDKVVKEHGYNWLQGSFIIPLKDFCKGPEFEKLLYDSNLDPYQMYKAYCKITKVDDKILFNIIYIECISAQNRLAGSFNNRLKDSFTIMEEKEDR